MSAKPPPPPPPVRVILPDRQELRGRLHARRQFEQGGWMFWVGLPMWAFVPETEGVEPREYRVWLTAQQAHPIEGVAYDQVPSHPLGREDPTAAAADRWAWKVQRVKSPPAGVVVHVWDCEEAPEGSDELGLFEALDVLRRPGAVACEECGADVALGPLV
ncbi:DUF6233 domain-containing protein [Streptomyces sp. NPDC097610]|uniref:DUF6233 domain-containing protein n=1 Tax=Streptomyces sp. NPDC097610 TaxID=3157227 RepID=UPI0033233306